MKTIHTPKVPTYTATFNDDSSVIYTHEPNGNLIGLLPLGARPDIFNTTPNGDQWDGASGVTPSGRAFTIRRD